MSVPDRPMTAKVLASWLTEVGYPTTENSLAKHRHEKTGPVPFAKWGRSYLYRPADALAWAESRVKLIVREAAE